MAEAVVLRVLKGQLGKLDALTIHRPEQSVEDRGVVVVGTSCRYESGGCVNGKVVLERGGNFLVAIGFVDGRGTYVIHNGCKECSSRQVARG